VTPLDSLLKGRERMLKDRGGLKKMEKGGEMELPTTHYFRLRTFTVLLTSLSEFIPKLTEWHRQVFGNPGL